MSRTNRKTLIYIPIFVTHKNVVITFYFLFSHFQDRIEKNNVIIFIFIEQIRHNFYAEKKFSI